MDAQEKGRQAGFAAILSFSKITKEQFIKVGEYASKRAYKTDVKRQNFQLGWNENWREPHAKDCKCWDCEEVRSTPSW